MKTYFSYLHWNEEKKKTNHTDESVPVSEAVGEKGAVSIQTLNPTFGAWCGGDGLRVMAGG